MSARTAAASALLALLALVPAASAHVTVAPERVAPGSVVELAIRVPNERDLPTTKVAVQIPAGLEVFSFSEVPGWTREATEAADGTLQSVTWTGSLSAGSYVSFDLLGSTPDQPGELVFKAVQTYEGGEEVAWIGAPDSDEPAPVVEVTADAASGGAARTTATTTRRRPPALTPAAASTAEAPATSAAEPTTVPEAATSAPAGDRGGRPVRRRRPRRRRHARRHVGRPRSSALPVSSPASPRWWWRSAAGPTPTRPGAPTATRHGARASLPQRAGLGGAS